MKLAQYELNREMETALGGYGFTPCRASLLSPLGEKKGRRWAYRVEDEDGRVVKVRQFESDEVARCVFALRDGLEDAFSPALARYGAVLIEEWIEGLPFAGRETAERIEFAGALLGRLHARPLGPDEPATVSTRRWRESAHSDLEILETAGVLASGEAARLRGELEQRDPGTARTVLAHVDFCAANMLIDSIGRLRVIDNEQLAVEPPGFDLGRTFDLWPMTEESRARFRRGYQSSAPADPEVIGFWRIVAAALDARVFLHRSLSSLRSSLAQLRRFTEGKDLDEPSI